MPLRHQATEENMKEVLQHIEKMESLSATSNSLITRFRRATTKRLHGVSSNTDVLDILEREEVENDESDILKWPIIKTMKTFLQENGISSCNHVIVSLSGGVDSMVIAYLLTKLKRQYNFEVICIHIDYGNREEACVEAEYLENWCNRHNMIFRCRKITEIKRGVTKRDEYEKLSREIRFNTYQEVMNEFKNCSGVMLGHHKGDIQENVVSNMMKGCTLLNLSGMHRIQVISGVGIWRPLLPHPKSDILDFAHRYGVSYFKDTTPRWSNRGRLRNEVLPLVSDVWGDGFRHNLSTLASESEEFALLINTKIFDPFITKVTRTSVGVTIPVEEYKDQSSLFWKEAFKRVCEKVLGVPRIREKAVGNFIFKLGHKKTKPGFISMRQEFKSFLDSNNGTLTFFHPEFFPLKSKKRANFDLDPYVADGFEILPEVEYKFGPWKVFVGREDIACLGEEERVKLNNILTGSFSYCLPAYENPEYEIRAQLKARFYDFFQSIPRQIIHAIPVIKAKENGKRREDLCYRIQLTFQP